MSYIRSGSNPEGLYIFGSKSGVEIYPPWGHSAWGKLIPYDVWNGFCKQYVNEIYPEELEYNGLTLKSEWVEDQDGRNFKVVLKYEDWKIVMWDVTWFYIIRRFPRKEI